MKRSGSPVFCSTSPRGMLDPLGCRPCGIYPSRCPSGDFFRQTPLRSPHPSPILCVNLWRRLSRSFSSPKRLPFAVGFLFMVRKGLRVSAGFTPIPASFRRLTASLLRAGGPMLPQGIPGSGPSLGSVVAFVLFSPREVMAQARTLSNVGADSPLAYGNHSPTRRPSSR